MAEVSQDGPPPQPPPALPEQASRGRGAVGRGRWLALGAGLAVVLAVACGAYLTLHDASPEPLDRGGRLEDRVRRRREGRRRLRSVLAPSATAYRQTPPSLVEIETDRRRRGAGRRGSGRRVTVNRSGADPHRAPRRRRRGQHHGHLRRRHEVGGDRSSTDPSNDIAVLAPTQPRRRSCRQSSAAAARSATRRTRSATRSAYVGSLTAGWSPASTGRSRDGRQDACAG